MQGQAAALVLGQHTGVAPGQGQQLVALRRAKMGRRQLLHGLPAGQAPLRAVATTGRQAQGGEQVV